MEGKIFFQIFPILFKVIEEGLEEAQKGGKSVSIDSVSKVKKICLADLCSDNGRTDRAYIV